VYDQDGRETSAISYSGATVPTSSSTAIGIATTGYGTASPTTGTTYYETETVSDQIGHTRTLGKDALGRLTAVLEDPGSLKYSTVYSYDSLDNLATAQQQSSVSRSFAYSSLGRLTNAVNPESGSISYTYDNDGNVLTRSGPLATTCWGNWSSNSCDNSGYDSLNEPTLKSYSDGTPAATYSYTYGRLMNVSNSISATSFTYDGLGRISTSQQQTANQTYGFQYGYNLTDALTSETYPSGRTVTTNYDGTNRVSSVTGSFNGSTPTYANNLVYSPHGAATQVAYGNNLWRSSSYNSLLQMSDFVDALNNSGANEFLNVSLSWYANGNLSAATFNHGGAAANNGGISYTNFLTFNQTYSYDNVNRLIGVSDTGTTCTGAPPPPSSTPVCYSRGFGYDAYGNMWVTSPTGIVPAGNTPQSNVYNGSNRITSGTYNAAGNETIVNGNTITYDAEGRQTSVVGAGVNETYAYGGDGNRVEKAVGGSPQTVFVYDALGRMAAEYSAGAETPACITCYFSPDHLGTPRMVTDQNANVVARHDYLPFGEEVPANVAGRNSQWGTGNDTINQKFTGKERDAESGLDYFGARYYGSALGRFTSVDPKMSPHNIRDPQSWNKYVYARNNPLQYVDPDGRDWQTVKNNLVAAFNGTVNAFKLAGEALGHAYTSVGKNLSENPGFSFSSITFEDANNIGKNLTLGAVLGPEGGVLEGAGAAESAAASASTSSDVMFTHFTDGQGLQGITGLDPATLGSGETTTVSTLQFGTGNNSYLAGQSGDIFATNLPANTSSLSLSQIGVFGDKQSFGISFSGTDAASQGVMVQGQGEGIYTLPAGSKLTGCFTVTCRQ